MEDNTYLFLQIKEDFNILMNEDNLNLIKMEDDLNILANGKQPQQKIMQPKKN